jgi:hypothetical protein
MDKSATITFCDVSENHVGMKKIGQLAERGTSVDQLRAIADKCADRRITCELVRLTCSARVDVAEAAILIIRNGINEIMGGSREFSDLLYTEQYSLPHDTKALMRGRVVNKLARHNLCFGNVSSEPDYAAGSGRVIAFGAQIPYTTALFNAIREFTNIDIQTAEGNYYYNPAKCGISMHTDLERKIVVAARLGVPFPLVFQWYLQCEPIGDPHVINLNHGDIYIMSEKAVGHDGRRRIIPTLRHAAGCKKYTGI